LDKSVSRLAGSSVSPSKEKVVKGRRGCGISIVDNGDTTDNFVGEFPASPRLRLVVDGGDTPFVAPRLAGRRWPG
jgi:hypothetical protein